MKFGSDAPRFTTSLQIDSRCCSVKPIRASFSHVGARGSRYSYFFFSRLTASSGSSDSSVNLRR